jgi:hypothetical protein
MTPSSKSSAFAARLSKSGPSIMGIGGLFRMYKKDKTYV